MEEKKVIAAEIMEKYNRKLALNRIALIISLVSAGFMLLFFLLFNIIYDIDFLMSVMLIGWYGSGVLSVIVGLFAGVSHIFAFAWKIIIKLSNLIPIFPINLIVFFCVLIMVGSVLLGVVMIAPVLLVLIGRKMLKISLEVDEEELAK